MSVEGDKVGNIDKIIKLGENQPADDLSQAVAQRQDPRKGSTTFYGTERTDVESEIPDAYQYFVNDIARPSSSLSQNLKARGPIDYTDEIEAESLIELVDLVVRRGIVGFDDLLEKGNKQEKPAGSPTEEDLYKDNSVYSVNDLISSFGEKAGLYSERQDADLKQEQDVDPTSAPQILVDLEEAIKKLLKVTCKNSSEAEDAMALLQERTKKTKESAHRDLQIQDEYECMCFALHFYQWLVEMSDGMAEPERYLYVLRGHDLLFSFYIKPSHIKQLHDWQTKKIQFGYGRADSAKLVVWWIQMALNFMNSYRGKSTRYLTLDLQDPEQSKVFEYFQRGKVFNWPNFSITTRNTSSQKIPPPSSAWKKWNVCFHIYGYSGKLLARMPGEDKDDYETVIFRPNTQFLVCDTKQTGDKLEVWLREIQLGLSRDNVLWIDENIFRDEGQDQFAGWVRYTCDHMNIKLIMKTSARSAWHYINSQAFRKTVAHSKSFKIIVNKTSYVDVGSQNLPYEVAKPWHSGPRFLEWFVLKGPQKELKPNLFKVKLLLSEASVEDAKRAMQEIGMNVQQIQLLAIWLQIKNDTSDFLEFLTGQDQEVIRDDAKQIFVEEAFNQKENTSTLAKNIQKIQKIAEVTFSEAERLLGEAKGNVHDAMNIFKFEQSRVQQKTKHVSHLKSLEEHFGAPESEKSFAEEADTLREWELNLDESDADEFLRLTVDQKENHGEICQLIKRFRDLTVSEAIAFHQYKILEKQGYLQKFELFCHESASTPLG